MKKFAPSILVVFAVGAIAATAAAIAAPSANDITVTNQVSEDFITCSVFFTITAQGVENRGKPEDFEDAKKLRGVSQEAMSWGFTLSFAIGQKPEVMQLKPPIIAEMMIKEMGGHFMNYSILSAKYLKKCLEMIHDPAHALAVRLDAKPQ